MQKAIQNYVARKLIEDLRAREPLDEEFLVGVTKRPFIDSLRQLIVPDDKELVLELIGAGTLAARRLGIGLTRNILADDEVRECLLRLWREADDIETRKPVVFRLLDLTDLPVEMHRELYAFVRDHWDYVLADEAAFFGPRNVLDGCRERLSDPSFLPSKAWVYLCIATQAPQRDQVEELLEQYLQSGESINAEVAEELLREMREE